MAYSNVDNSSKLEDLNPNKYVLDPDLVELLIGFFESKGFDSKTSQILSTSFIVTAIDDGAITRKDVLNLQKQKNLQEVNDIKIQRPGQNYVPGDQIIFSQKGILQPIVAEVSSVNQNGGIVSLDIINRGIIEIKPTNPLSPSNVVRARREQFDNTVLGPDGTGAFFILTYRFTSSPSAELMELAAYLLNVSRYPSSFTGIQDDPEQNLVFGRLVI